MLALIALVIAGIVLTRAIVQTQDNVRKLQRNLDTQVQQLKNTQNSKIQSQGQTIQQLMQSQTQKDVQIQDLNSKLQSKKHVTIELAKAVIEAPVAHVATSQSVNSAKLWIYMHESGNNPSSINKSSGACGLGQALPCSKMPCKLGDYICQDNFFTGYMIARYGSWDKAQAFWILHSWW